MHEGTHATAVTLSQPLAQVLTGTDPPRPIADYANMPRVSNLSPSTRSDFR